MLLALQRLQYQTYAIMQIVYTLGAQLTQMSFCNYQESTTLIEPTWKRPMKPWFCNSCLSLHFEQVTSFFLCMLQLNPKHLKMLMEFNQQLQIVF
jgi:hypothetical protein